MADSEKTGLQYSSTFVDKMEGGAFIFSAEEGHALLYVNDKLISLFECESKDELLEHVSRSFDGMIHDPSPQEVCKEIRDQLPDSLNRSGYVFFNIITKKGNVRRVVDHWTLVHDSEHGDIFYSTIYLHRLDNTSSDFDPVTGLPGKNRFVKHVTDMNRRAMDEGGAQRFAIVYSNLVHFKLLNLERGVSEGNVCLKELAKALGKAFEGDFVTRLSSDYFVVFTEYEGVEAKTEKAVKCFEEVYGRDHNIRCKLGIYGFEPGEDFFCESAFSFAKTACDSIKTDDKRNHVEYTDELAESFGIAEYVAAHIDEAIEKGWIKVYFQPVVRSLTEDACSMESLVRWIDPKYGFLPPDKFIGALEKEHCIHKLDCYVVDRVCSIIGDRLKKGLPTVPASVNFSRLDFVMTDMLEVVKTAVEKYGVPKDYIHIEITESMISSDEELMRRVIDEFRRSGYEIWMDDFGSGYSSLTVLKDYDFNTVKLDMRFLTPLNGKSKSIIRSVVSMAKDIGMKTLAEGVETKEQLEFLREIGCGLIQGYYYGKPEPVDDVFAHLDEKGIDRESIEWRDYYQAASFNARDTEMPLEIIEDDGNNFRTLFMNQAYRDQIFSGDFTLEDIDSITYNPDSPLAKKYREFADIVESSGGKKKTFYYIAGGNNVCLTLRQIAEHDGHHIIEGSIYNLSREEKQKREDRIFRHLRALRK